MTETAHMTVEGMSCNGCFGKLQRALEAVNGVKGVDIVLDRGKVTVSYDPAQLSVAALREVVEDTGFDVVS
ncbi:heavy-metal-associated domain-containing protein [Gluconobacter sphaericus]|uniref:Copper chaperone CopZ n=1 Tax=Gluconobacter sphaericus NBRC 12467 TaxID=1307951 RepID=A0AA37SG32_9PROT|nr:heavy-metal-associated domain-containing protein [Gluconobacter sphaericus]MBF0885049.1 heavy-metal-associated domain-containing protein [Gluconobacter sphaericus]MBS1085819.1 heavy-metal-associated domain-containing protein [Gluconobacter sphaericus]MBS1099708.1 heavy-metal-associated domain-containing protein [Gluconobacter sphaericus]QQX91770.1 heavy-metal-associated domain-containing protein [Gluconobacter sphaericus]GBR51423.1 cation/copper resistance transporter ATPase CopZ [Gluconoba